MKIPHRVSIFAAASAALSFSATSALSASGIFESYIVLNLGGSDIFYDLSAATGNPDFSGANLGTFNATGTNSSILFKGGEVKTFKNSGSNVTGAEVDYRITLGTGSGSFITNGLNFGQNIGLNGDQQWIKTDYSTQLISNGMSAGVYSFDAFGKAFASDGNTQTTTYTANFNIQATDYTWGGGGGTGATGTAANWVGGVRPGQGHNLIYNNTNNAQVTITNAFTTINALTFASATTSAFTISGTAFTLGNAAGLTGVTATPGITNSGSATQTVNAVLTLGNAVTFGASGGSITLGGSTLNLGTNRLTVTGANNTTITNLISATSTGGNILKSGSGTLVLSGANTYSGNSEIDAGTLRVDANPGNATSNYFVGNGGTTGTAATLLLGGADGTGGGVTLNNAIQANLGSGSNRVIGGSNTTGVNTFGGTLTLTDNNATLQAATGGTIAFNTVTGATLRTVAVGTGGNTGIVRMGGSTDNVNIAATVNFGTLELAKTSTAIVHALGSLLTVNSGATAKITGTGGDQIFDSASATVNSGGVLDLNGQNETINILTLSGTGISSSGALINNNGLTTSTLIASGGITLSSTSSIGGSANIATSSGISGGFGVTKVGNGALVLSGNNTFTGGTSISGGTLSLTGSGNLSGTSSVIMTGGTLLLGTSDRIAAVPFTTGGGAKIELNAVANYTETVGTLSLGSGNTVIDFGTMTGTNILRFAASTFSGAGTLQVWNWSGNLNSGNGTDQLFFGTTNTGLTGGTSGSVEFFRGSQTGSLGFGTQLATGELVVVPEASSLLAALSLVGLAFRRDGRHRQKTAR